MQFALAGALCAGAASVPAQQSRGAFEVSITLAPRPPADRTALCVSERVSGLAGAIARVTCLTGQFAHINARTNNGGREVTDARPAISGFEAAAVHNTTVPIFGVNGQLVELVLSF